MPATALPAVVLAAAEARVSAIRELTGLGGLSGRSVLLVEGDGGSVVVKGPVPPAEAAVATTLASAFAERGVRTAACLDAVEAPESGVWLVLEHLPHALPRERWGADAAVLDVLRRLHGLETSLVDGIPDRYSPSWDDELTALAATALHADAATGRLLERLQRETAPLLEPRVVVSGDANPLNWRLDANGEPALIDWERLTLGTPAVDVGILLPGLPAREAAEAAAAGYGPGVESAEDLLLVKAWSIVELAATAEAGSDAAQLIVDVRDDVRVWLASTFER